MAQHGCSADAAFQKLTLQSQSSNTKLRDLAQQIVDSIQPVGTD